MIPHFAIYYMDCNSIPDSRRTIAVDKQLAREHIKTKNQQRRLDMKATTGLKVAVAGLVPENRQGNNCAKRFVGSDGFDHVLTDPHQPRSAGQHVLETTELLEQILSYLPMKKIFNIQSVCWQWKNTIVTSPRLQERMILRLKSTRKETWIKEQVKSVVKVWNDTLHPRYKRFETITPVIPHPELRLDTDCKSKNLGIDCMTHTGKAALRWVPAEIRQHFSLLDAFITDPPCKTADICLTVRFHKPLTSPKYRTSYPFKIWVNKVRASSETGLTFQDVLRAALNARRIDFRDGLLLPSNGPIGYKCFAPPFDASLREAIDLLPRYTGIKEFLDCPVMEARITLIDDVAVPTVEEWTAISKPSR